MPFVDYPRLYFFQDVHSLRKEVHIQPVSCWIAWWFYNLVPSAHSTEEEKDPGSEVGLFF